MKNFVFIVLPVYNWEKYLLQQLMSIYYQDYPNWHLIIINDWSTDRTENIINKFKKDYNLSDRITLITQKNQWLNTTIKNWLLVANKQIEWLKIDKKNTYIAYCDADDLMMTNKLSYQIKYMNDHMECMMTYHDLILIDESNSIINFSYINKLHSPFNNIYDDSFYEFCLSNHVPSTTIMFRSLAIDLLIPFPSNFPFQDWWTSLIISSKKRKIDNLKIPLWFYRRYPTQMSSKSQENMIGKYREFIQSLKEVQKRGKNFEIDVFVEYYQKKIMWEYKWNNKILQTIKTLLLFNKISYLYVKRFILFLITWGNTIF